jgi:hypothetical protein
VTSSRKPSLRLRIFGGVVLICVIVATANYYLDLGWFGRYARLAVSVSILLGLILHAALIKVRREDARAGEVPLSSGNGHARRDL